MKLHYITIQPTTSVMSEELRALEETFLTQSSCQPLAKYEKELHSLMKKGDWDAAEELCNKLRVDVEQKEVDVEQKENEPLWAPRLRSLLTNDAQKQGKDQQPGVKYVYKCVKEIRQEYWLAWLEDFFCEKIEWALWNCMQKREDGKEHLYCVALPEFTFVDSGNAVGQTYGPTGKGNRAFYKSVVTMFLQGSLPNDVPRPGSQKRTLKQLTELLNYEKKQIIIFAGTIIGRNREPEKKEAEKGRSPYYNMAPVFTKGRCVGVWEKQEIADTDGKSFMPKHRHVTWSDMHQEGILGYTASVFSQEELHTMKMKPLSPVFEIEVFQRGQHLRFALCICLDYSIPQNIYRQSAEVYVLIAYGMKIETKCNIKWVGKDVEVFLYCDGIQRAGNGDRRGQVCIQRGDSAFWSQKTAESKRTWLNIDMKKLSDFSYNQGYARPGIYISPKVPELNLE